MRSPSTIRIGWTLAALAMALVLFQGCSKAEKPQPEPQAQQATTAPEPASQAAAEPGTPQAQAPAAPPQASAPPPETKPAAPAPPPKPESAAASQTKPATPVPSEPPASESPAKEAPAPPAPAPAAAPSASQAPPHAAVGSEKCKMCHKVQYESWAASKHAKATPPVTCETCHGNGADYAIMSVMKDASKAKAAGLIMPGTEFCTAKCHKASGFGPDMLQKAHAHKVK